MKTAKLVIIRLLIVILTAFFVVQINTVKVIAEDTSNVQFERSITGATGYTFCQTNLLKTPQKNSDVIITIDAGEAFTILDEIGTYWIIQYYDAIGFVEYKNCLINLPDIMPSIEYNISNAEYSVYRCNNEDIPELTGMQLYYIGKPYNKRLGKNEFVAPIAYSTAKYIAKAQYLANEKGYSLKIYDTYRPHEVTDLASRKLSRFYNDNTEIQKVINTYTENGKSYSWGQGWFLASGVSTHNTGAALDVTLVNLETGEEAEMPSPMHELSTLSVKYPSGSSKTYAVGMTEEAILLDEIFKEAGMSGLASEWWHFQDNATYARLKTLNNGDFQVNDVVSMKELDATFILIDYIHKNKITNINYELYQSYIPESPETKPLMVVIPGMGGGFDGSYTITGLYQYIQDKSLAPDCTIVFFYRPGYNAKIDKDLVKGVIDSMPHTDLYYCGFSLGAWDFHKYLSTGDYKKAILIDGYDTNFTSETTLEDVIVVQSYENHCDEYEMALYSMWEQNNNLDYLVIDLTEQRAHVECAWWLFAPTDEEYYKYKSVDFKYPVYDIMSKLGV